MIIAGSISGNTVDTTSLSDKIRVMEILPGFKALGLSDETLEALKEKGFEEPTEIQRLAIPRLLEEGTEIVGQAQTGTGKTAAFALPIIETISNESQVPGALVLVPTRELASQVSEEISSLKGKKKLEVTPIYGGASMEQQLRKLKRGVQIVVGTPGRILDHIRRGSLKLENLEFLVLDEADEMLDMGFIDDIEQVLRAVPEKKRMLMFSATMPPEIMKLAESFMKNPEIIRTQKKDTAAITTDQIYYEVREGDKLEALTRIIDREKEFYGVVFCRTKLQCDEIGTKLRDRGYDAASLHGDLSQREREAILKKMKDHQLSILVATDVAARGLDIQDLTHVINYTIPSDPEIYIHRVGRTGRAGKTGTAITFITPSEARKLNYIMKASRADIRKEEIPTAEDIIEGKKQRIRDQIEEALSVPPRSEYMDIARTALAGRDPEEAFAGLLSLIYRNELDISQYRHIEAIAPKSQKEKKSRRERKEEARNREPYDKVRTPSLDDQGTTKLFIARGRRDGLTKGMLCNIIMDQAGVRDQDIGDIEILEDCSFVTAPYAIAEDILNAYSGRTQKGKPVIMRAKQESRKTPKKETRKKSAAKTRKRRNWEDDYQPYGRDTRPGEDGRLSFPERKRDKARGGRRRRK